METIGQWSGLGTHRGDLPDLCTHTASHLLYVTLKQTAHNLTETFSGYERTISQNDEERLLLAQWFDLAPVHSGINGMVVGMLGELYL